MPAPSDTLLVEAIRDGAAHRYAEVVARFDDAVRATLRRQVRDASELEELVQETFYLGFRDLGQLTDPSRLGAWLCAIARRRLQDRRRQQVRDESRHQNASSESLLASDASDTWIWEEVDQLSDLFRIVLRLRYRDGLSYREIASALDVPASTVRGRIYEARRALRERVRELEDRR